MLIALLATLGVGTIVAARLLSRSRQRWAEHRRRLRATALDVGEDGVLSGRVKGFQVSVSSLESRRPAILKVENAPGERHGLPRSLELQMVSVAERLMGAGDVATGDEPFDNIVRVQGDEPKTLALLDAATRQGVEEALIGGLRVADGCVFCETDIARVVDDVARAVELAGILSLSADDVSSRLARNASLDPVAEVRLRNLDVLLKHWPQAPPTKRALQGLLQDPVLEVRLRAAIALGPRGHSALLGILGHRETDVPRAIEAFDILSDALAARRLWPAIDAAMAHESRWVRERALQELLRIGGAEAVERLVRLVSDADPEIAAKAARAIGHDGDASCEASLIEALHAEDLKVREAAAEALGAVGTVAAVVPLRKASGGGAKALLVPELAHAAREAIARIQSRLKGAAAGQVSLAETRATRGELSLAPGASRGRLTLSKGETPARRRKATAGARAARRKRSPR